MPGGLSGLPNRQRGAVANLRQAASSAACRLTSALLILLFGKYSEYSKLRSGSQMSSSQTFLPRSSSSGREQKSISHTDERGTVLPPAAALVLGWSCAVSCAPTALAATLRFWARCNPLETLWATSVNTGPHPRAEDPRTGGRELSRPNIFCDALSRRPLPAGGK